MSERLRAFVRQRVRRGESLYQRSVAANLAKYLGRPSSWVSEYSDPKPAQPRYANVEDTLKILAFFRERGDDPAPTLFPGARAEPEPMDPEVRAEIFRVEYREALDPPVSQAETSRRLGWSNNRMNEFELGKRGVTVENAIALGELTGTSPEFWMNLQVRHDLWHALKAAKGKSALAGEPFAATEAQR